MKTKIKILLLSGIFWATASLSGQTTYFADGYHGGIFGHYPMWKTQFMVDKMNEFPHWAMNIEIEPATWDTVKLKDPQAYLNFKNMATDKRIDFVNPTFAQPYMYNISGESIIRQFHYGMKRHWEHFPGIEFVTYSAEEPCFTSSLPQILKSFGFKYAVLKNPNTCWGGYTRGYGGQLVNWIGPDKTSILTVPRYASEELEENSTWQTKAWRNSPEYFNAALTQGIENPIGMCIQDAGWKGGPWIGYEESNHTRSIYTTWTNYIENVSAMKSDDNWRLSQEDLQVNLMWGSQALQRIAQQVRESENKIISAEKFTAMTFIESSYQADSKLFNDAWTTLLLAQHHDSWIVPYNRLHGDVTWADEIRNWTNNTNRIVDAITSEALKTENSSEKYTSNIKVYNTLLVPRKEVVSVSIPTELGEKNIEVYNSKNEKVSSVICKGTNGTILHFDAAVPQYGYSNFTLKASDAKKAVQSAVKYLDNSMVCVENDMYRLTFDLSQGGKMTSVIAKKLGNREFVDKSNDVGFGEIKGHFYEDSKFMSSVDNAAQFTVLEDNELVVQVKIDGTIAGHPFSQTVKLEKNQKLIDFNLVINWNKNVGIGEYEQKDNWRDNRRAFHDDRFKLNIYFPSQLSEQKVYKNAPFDVTESALEDTFFNTWDNIKNNIILNWIDVADGNNKYGLALLSDHTTSYSHGKDFPLALTLQYSGIGLWGVNYLITEPLNVKYALMPHQGKWDVANIDTENEKWNAPLLPIFTTEKSSKDKSLLEFEGSGYTLTSAQVEGKDIVLRVFNTEGDESAQKLSFHFPVNSVDEIDLRGNVLNSNILKQKDGKASITMQMPRFGFKSYRIK